MQTFDDVESPESHIENERRESVISRVLAVDPNGGRCLVENCSPIRGIDYCHVVPRKFWRRDVLICTSTLIWLTITSPPLMQLDSLEWYWGMRRNTLNLETRRNIFPAGASVHRMYDAGQWILVPEEHIVQMYHDVVGKHPLRLPRTQRASFPAIPDQNDFQYRLLLLHDLSEIAFFRQDDTNTPLHPGSFTTHFFPFATLPPLVSHVHPKFVIVSAGSQLLKLSEARLGALETTYPIIASIIDLFVVWSGSIPVDAQLDPSYYPAYKPGPDGDDDRDDNEGNGGDDPTDKDYSDAKTEKGRDTGSSRKIPRHESPTPYPGTSKGTRHNLVDRNISHNPTKRKSSTSLSRASVRKHACKVGKMEWSKDAVAEALTGLANVYPLALLLLLF